MRWGEHVQGPLLLRQEAPGSPEGSPEGSGSSGVHALAASTPVCHTALLQRRPAGALLGAAQALLRSIFNILMIGSGLRGRYCTAF